MEGGLSFKHFANWFVILAMNESARLSSKVIPAICPRMLDLKPFKTRGLSRILISSLYGTVGAFSSGPQILDGVVTLCPSRNFHPVRKLNSVLMAMNNRYSKHIRWFTGMSIRIF